jgi:membrane protein
VTKSSSGTAGTVFALSTLTALWSFSGLISNLMAAVNRIWGLKETRSFVHRRLIAIGMAIVTAIVTTFMLVAIALGGGIASRIVAKTGLGPAWDPVLRVGAFVVLLVIFTGYLAIVYWLAPNKEHRVFRWISVGALVATLLWLLVTVAFVVYVVTFASYNKVYGPLAGAVIFIFWLYLSSLAMLLGAAVDAEIEKATPAAGDDEPVRGIVPDPTA